jgi:predicted dehydrogenase
MPAGHTGHRPIFQSAEKLIHHNCVWLSGMTVKRTLRVGLIGYNFMGKAHSNAWRQIAHFFDLPVDVQLTTICGRDRAGVKKAAAKLGWQGFVTDWRRVVDDPNIDIVDICTPNDSHCAIAIAAAESGKAILCEKPLGRSVGEVRKMVAAVKRAHVINMVCHNYRRVPAIVLAKQIIDRQELGQPVHFHARYAQDWIVDPGFPLVWRFQSKVAGSGALGDIFSHIVDLARYLVGEFEEVCAIEKTFVRQRPLATLQGRGPAPRRRYRRVDVDDAVTMIGRFQNGALASLEATRFAPGRKNSITLEINGTNGSLYFDLEEMNRLKLFRRDDPENEQGFRDILVTEPTHPYIKNWWPPGHTIGYEHTFAHTIADFVTAVSTGKSVPPTFEDGWKNQCVLDAAARSWRRKCATRI